MATGGSQPVGRADYGIRNQVNRIVASPDGKPDPDLIITATALFFGAFGFRRWRTIESGMLRQLHNISLLIDDQKKLAKRLATCELVMGDSQQAPGILALERLQRRHAPGDAGSHDLSLAVKANKIQVLLQLWGNDEESWGALLPRSDKLKLSTIEHAHARRLTLASRVDEYIERIERGEADPAEIAKFMDALKMEEYIDEEALGRLKDVASASKSASSDEKSIQKITRPLVEFFVNGYNEQINEFAAATAKATIMSGDDAERKLDILRAAGFSGLGHIEGIDLHRALLMIFFIFIFVLVVFFGVPELLEQLDILPEVAGKQAKPVIFFNIVVEIAGLEPPVPGVGFLVRMILIGFVTTLIGFFLGFFILRDVRAAALSSIVADDNLPAE